MVEHGGSSFRGRGRRQGVHELAEDVTAELRIGGNKAAAEG